MKYFLKAFAITLISVISVAAGYFIGYLLNTVF